MFFKIINNLTPVYTKDPIPTLQHSNYSLRNRDAIGRLKARAEKFKSSFYPHCLSEWNELDPEVKLVPSVAVFKKKLLSIIRPPARSIFGIHDPTGLFYLTQIKVGYSRLNFHKFKHNFRHTVNPICPTNDGIKDTEHFLLLCPSLAVPRRDLLTGVFALLLPFGYTNLQKNVLLQILLYDDENFSYELNKNILLLTIQFIHKSGRFYYNILCSCIGHDQNHKFSFSFSRMFNVCLELDAKQYL